MTGNHSSRIRSEADAAKSAAGAVASEREERSTVRPMLSVQQGDRAALASKIVQAERLLRSLPASDERARLLNMALVRRDESLLDALLREPANVK